LLLENLIGRRLFNDPREAQTPGHKILLRGGYVRQIGQGIYSLLPLAQRACSKIENIIREEMNKIGGQEILMPVVIPSDLWVESGRYATVGSELVRFKDRTGHDCILNMTHEEVVVDVARSQVDSYRQLPFMVYQIQTKFRDEPRSRGGLLRVREFTMKDAYSFHRTQKDLEKYYDICHKSYSRIFERCGLRHVVDILSDSGMMGGAVAHEFMLVTPVGEDTIFLCDSCDYRANREVAKAVRKYNFDEELKELEDIETPGQKTIEEVSNFIGTTPDRCCKAVGFMADEKNPVIAFVRGDLEVNLSKLKNTLGSANIRPMQDEEFTGFGSVPGFVGPVGLNEDAVKLVFDVSVKKTPNLVIGGNAPDLHRTGFNFGRDYTSKNICEITEVNDGDPCPGCGKALSSVRGVEVGNIFQLGTKYTKAMEFTYPEENGSQKYPIMGCYGIGVGRTMACVIEESHDENGPIWPISIAPFKVHICCLQAQKAGIRDAGQNIHDELEKMGIETILDTRKVGAGFMFSDADLIGAPIRVILSRRNLKDEVVEMKYRIIDAPEDLPENIEISCAAEKIKELCDKLKEKYI
jgi:prolyl-tRNA synthetase